jgi:hypothetical protein
MLDVFLTAYDPSDLPGNSIDPLGFERGYLFLADKILPGMTNVASCPRYFGVLCTGAMLAQIENDATQRELRAERQMAIQRLERLWALANVLSANKETNLSGLRGVTYAQRQVGRLERDGVSRTSLDYKLLSRQAPYGVIGIYGAVAEGVKLLFRKTYDLTPGLGARLADAFIDATEMQGTLRKAVKDGSDVSVNMLREWGKRAYLWGIPSREERECFTEMLNMDAIRSRFTGLLREIPSAENEPELARLSRIARQASLKANLADLRESSDFILQYEACYRTAMVGMERLLFLCHTNVGGVDKAVIASDPVLKKIVKILPKEVAALKEQMTKAQTPHFTKDTEERLRDVRRFLDYSADACGSGTLELAKTIVSRHADVQHGKFDRGQRKMAWVQWQDDLLTLTLTKVDASYAKITKPVEIIPHPYRLAAADAWIRAADKT